jgi:tRNA pseudouridine38-40 synthase
VNLRLTLSYDGSGFRGWARQPGARTIEGTLADALDARYPGWSGLAVAGRTDTGVHALGQVVSVTVGTGPPAANAALALNAVLPPDVVVRSSAEAPEDFNARYSARARAYVYRVRVVRDPSALDARRALHHRGALDRSVLAAWAEALRGTHDFTAFTPTETQHLTFVRNVHHAAWHEVGEELRFSIAASSFLRHQVRTLVGTMLLAARGERCASPAELLEGAHRRLAGPTAPPHGLYLAGVRFAGEPDGVELVGIP